MARLDSRLYSQQQAILHQVGMNSDTARPPTDSLTRRRRQVLDLLAMELHMARNNHHRRTDQVDLHLVMSL